MSSAPALVVLDRTRGIRKRKRWWLGKFYNKDEVKRAKEFRAKWKHPSWKRPNAVCPQLSYAV